jgi:hypothetical protein
MKMISTIAVTTVANFITACQTNKKTFSTAKQVFQKISEGYEQSGNEVILKNLIIPTLSGFVVSTIPAIGLNIINGVFFKQLSQEKALQYAAMGGTFFLSKDLYAEFVKSQISEKIDTGLGESFDKMADSIASKGADAFNYLTHSLSPEDCSRIYINKALDSKAYAINTVAQTLLLDLIWCDNDSSAEHPEL